MRDIAIERRRVLQLLCAAGVVAGPASAESSSSRVSSLLGGAGDADVHDLAAEYRRLGADEAGIAEVRSLLGDASTPEERTVARLRKSMNEDFGQGRVVVLAGWIVSKTEGRVWVAASDLLRARG